MTPEELHAQACEQLQRRKQEALRLGAVYRSDKAQAEAAGETGIAKTLGLLAANMEKSAALAEAEQRDRSARHDKHRVGRKARASSIERRQEQARQDAARMAALFKRACRPKMGRQALQAAAMALIGQIERELRDKLITAQQAENQLLQRQHSGALASLQRQAQLCTVHRAGKWLEQHRTST